MVTVLRGLSSNWGENNTCLGKSGNHNLKGFHFAISMSCDLVPQSLFVNLQVIKEDAKITSKSDYRKAFQVMIKTTLSDLTNE